MTARNLVQPLGWEPSCSEYVISEAHYEACEQRARSSGDIFLAHTARILVINHHTACAALADLAAVWANYCRGGKP